MCIGYKLSSQPKFYASHSVEAGVSGIHCHKDIPHGGEIFIHAALLMGFFFVVITPVLTLSAKICKNGTGSWMPFRTRSVNFCDKFYVWEDIFEG